jgi:hypothetical protein
MRPTLHAFISTYRGKGEGGEGGRGGLWCVWCGFVWVGWRLGGVCAWYGAVLVGCACRGVAPCWLGGWQGWRRLHGAPACLFALLVFPTMVLKGRGVLTMVLKGEGGPRTGSRKVSLRRFWHVFVYPSRSRLHVTSPKPRSRRPSDPASSSSSPPPPPPWDDAAPPEAPPPPPRLTAARLVNPRLARSWGLRVKRATPREMQPTATSWVLEYFSPASSQPMSITGTSLQLLARSSLCRHKGFCHFRSTPGWLAPKGKFAPLTWER